MAAAAEMTAGTHLSARRGSITKSRRRALFWAYFFLVLFAVFFLTPPIYMLITSLKSSGEIASVINPWWVFHPT
ncbi:MAG: carbohydrate ABC transporter permease, partial [Alphaproteobacteria bacterium]|nr:carbohydrate ABC transporter permease [Alphaproteobacteria bacterium]